ncbi:MAG TPA: hypothetical protein QGH10_05610 [Armatimonadota bacterium]|nr:hypothetical protein [Armatimonadota bacterium]
MTIGKPLDRPDRLIALTGQRPESLLAEYSADDGVTWNPATIYVGTTIDEWRPCAAATWNKGAIEGCLPVGIQQCLWNYFFDLEMPMDSARFRLKRAEGEVVLSESVDLSGAQDVLVISARNATELAGGDLPRPWQLERGGKKTPVVASIFCPVDDVTAPPLVLSLDLTGWYRIYIGMEPYSAYEFYLSGEEIRYAIPDYLASPKGQDRDRFLQEFYLKSADLTGQDVCLAIGGARQGWRDASIHHIRLVPMTASEVAHHRDMRTLADAEGRPFAGYMEQCTPAQMEPAVLALRDHTRNEMRLQRDRGCTDVYVHVIRLGIKAWYYSDIVEREAIGTEEAFQRAIERTRNVFGGAVRGPAESLNWRGAAKWAAWMEQGDPLAVAIEEGRAAGLNVFADMGMNVTHITDAPQLTERFVIEHGKCLSDHVMFLDYREEAVRDYAVAVAGELLMKYDLDGINLDFGRWGYKNAYDEASLVDVVRRIHERRAEAEMKWRHPVTIATRIPSYMLADSPGHETYGGEHAWFVAALKTWAQNGWIDRVMPLVSHVRMQEFSMKRYKEAIAGTPVKLWGDLYWQGFDTPRSHHLDIARGWVSEGLDGGFFFYAHHRPTEYERINWMLRLIDFPKVAVEPY